MLVSDTGQLLRLDMLNQCEKSSGRERRSFCLDADRRLNAGTATRVWLRVWPAELVTFAEEAGVENASTMRKQEIMFAGLALQELSCNFITVFLR